jgi:hypothetical protein
MQEKPMVAAVAKICNVLLLSYHLCVQASIPFPVFFHTKIVYTLIQKINTHPVSFSPVDLGFDQANPTKWCPN